MTRILIVEDDMALCLGIEAALVSDEYAMSKAYNLKTAHTFINENTFDLIILDINLPDGNGVGFLKRIRESSGTPVILLTANDLESDIVSGLESGADDYITKPFSLAVLRARVHTRLRQNTQTSVFCQDDLTFNFDTMEFLVAGSRIELSKTEQKLLKLLTANKGVTLERSMLVDKIWTDGAEYVDENALSVTIKRLRSKLGNTSCIKTVYGIGYMWVV